MLYTGGVSNPNWDQNDEGNVHFIVAAFGLHVVFNVTVLLMMSLVMSSYTKCIHFARATWKSKISGNGYQRLLTDNSTDDAADTEYLIKDSNNVI